MKLVNLPIPAKLREKLMVRGSIVASDDPRDLSQDMLEIVLPNGVLVTVGWYRKDGAYRIAATKGLSHVVPPLNAEDAYTAADDVAELVASIFGEGGEENVCSDQVTVR